MEQKNANTIKDILLTFTPLVLTGVVGLQVYLFKLTLDTREDLIRYQKHVAESYVSKVELREDMSDIKATLRDIRDELRKN